MPEERGRGTGIPICRAYSHASARGRGRRCYLLPQTTGEHLANPSCRHDTQHCMQRPMRSRPSTRRCCGAVCPRDRHRMLPPAVGREEGRQSAAVGSAGCQGADIPLMSERAGGRALVPCAYRGHWSPEPSRRRNDTRANGPTCADAPRASPTCGPSRPGVNWFGMVSSRCALRPLDGRLTGGIA